MEQRYLPRDGEIVLEIVTEIVNQKKKDFENKLQLNPEITSERFITLKSCYISDDVRLEIKKRDPSNKLLREKETYIRQLTTKCLKLNGFKKTCLHSHKQAVSLRW